MHYNLSEIVFHFQVTGRLLEVEPCGTGHVNDTFASRFQTGKSTVRYIHQRINHHVFHEPEKVMENIERVTRHAQQHIINAGGDPNRETLNLVPTVDGRSFYHSPEGDYWRAYEFIEGARTYDKVEEARHVTSAAWAFGKFQKLLCDLPGERLHETIPDFHHTRKRFDAFVQALEKDVVNRARSVKAEIDFVFKREADTSVVVELLAQGRLPERVTHNDTKLNNVLIDDQSGEGVCVIDLDTVMPGYALYDFGDLVRTAAVTALEDDPDLAQVHLDLDMFDRLAQGYLDATVDMLTPLEIAYLPFAAKLITLEQGIRFLTDHLNGDVYYKIHRENHNLDRCRTQLKLVIEIEQKMEQMAASVNRYARPA